LTFKLTEAAVGQDSLCIIFCSFCRSVYNSPFISSIIDSDGRF